MSIVSVLLLMCAAVSIHFLNAPAQGRQIAPVDANKLVKSSQAAKSTPAQSLANSLFTLSLPPGYNVQSHDPTPSNLLYNQTITKPGAFGTIIIAIAVQNLPQGGLDGDASYTFRQQQPSVYTLTTERHGGDTVHIASDTSTSSVVAFWPHGSYLATISLSSGTDAPSGDNNTDSLHSLTPLLNAWQWQ